MFQRNPDEFLSIHYCGSILHPRRKNSQNNGLPDEPTPKKTVKSAEKVMVTIFWDARGIIHIDYLPSKKMINGDYYAVILLDRFNNILERKKHPHLAKKKLFFYQNNAYVPGTDGQIQRIPRIASPSSIFARFSPLLLFPVSKPEEIIRRKESHYQRAPHH